MGIGAGYNTTSGGYNSYYGINSGYAMKTGVNNAFYGSNSGYWFDGGSGNTFIGAEAGRGGGDNDPADPSGNYNTLLGSFTCTTLEGASNNVILGAFSGALLKTGNNNVFLGYQAGYYETSSNKLYIENSNAYSDNALIYGEFDNNILRLNGNTGISKTPVEKLDVNGAIRIGNSSLSNTGTIRWTGTDFEGYTNDGWASLTGSSKWSFSGDFIYPSKATKLAIGTSSPNTDVTMHLTGSATKSSLLLSPDVITEGNSEICLSEDKSFNSGFSISYVGSDKTLLFNGYLNGSKWGCPLTILNNDGYPYVGINETDPKEALTVRGNILIEGGGNVILNKGGEEIPDFVFLPDYKQLSIPEVKSFIETNGHLPWLSPAGQEKETINLSRMSIESLEAIENLQLQIISLKEENERLTKESADFKDELEMLKKEVELLKKQ